jgi:hypothetical protein
MVSLSVSFLDYLMLTKKTAIIQHGKDNDFDEYYTMLKAIANALPNYQVYYMFLKNTSMSY